MSITNGQPVDAADLNTLVSTQLGLVRADNALLPGLVEWNCFFHNVVASTAALRRTTTFVAPCDMILETLAVQATDFTNPSTLTVALTWNGEGVSFPVTVTSAAMTSGIKKLNRLLFDGTRTRTDRDFATTARMARVIRRGQTVTVVATTTSVATPTTLQICAVFREFFQR